jgi:hypothetical protein
MIGVSSRQIASTNLESRGSALLLTASLFVTAACCQSAAQPMQWIHFSGTCDASAAETLNETLVAVADDEDNSLRVYSLKFGGAPVVVRDLSSFLMVSPKSPEADLEGAARVEDRIYWISSHGRNAKGKDRPNRGQFFATRVTSIGGVMDLQPIGHAYHNLLADLLSEPKLAQFGLFHAAQLPPKSPGALNIEGLAATTNGHLLIGFRNPIPQGSALVVPLLNPSDLPELKPARFGEPILLDLQDLGVRSMTWFKDRFLILAGRFDEGGKSRLFEWKGGARKPRLLESVDGLGLNLEAMTTFSDGQDQDRLFLTSDDGTQLVDGMPCKRLKDPNRKHFRALSLLLPQQSP